MAEESASCATTKIEVELLPVKTYTWRTINDLVSFYLPSSDEILDS